MIMVGEVGKGVNGASRSISRSERKTGHYPTYFNLPVLSRKADKNPAVQVMKAPFSKREGL
jgi:hypothetical protein